MFVGAAAAAALASGSLSTGIQLAGAANVANAVAASLSTANAALTFPRVMLVGNGGDQSYGSSASNSYTPWLTAGSSSAAYAAVQQVAAWDAALLAGVYEGWDSSGARDRDNFVQALLKLASYSVKLNRARATLAFFYHVHSQGTTANSGGGYQQFINQIVAMNGWLYESAGGKGTITPAADIGNLINYATAWPAGVGSALIGQSIVGTNYGSTSLGSPTGAQGVARTSGNYAAIKLLIRNSAGIDSRFSFNPQMASGRAAGVVLDNCFAALDAGGAVANSYLDGISLAPGSQQGGGFPGLDTPMPLLARGNHNFFDQLQTMVAAYGSPGQVAYNFANFGQYANRYQLGSAVATCGLENTLHGGLLEDVFGAAAISWEYQQTGNPNTGGSYPSGWMNVLANYYAGMDFCLAPKLVGLGIRVPATDGSSPASCQFAVNGTLTNVITGSALEYQLMRYGLCTALLDDGYAAFGAPGYAWQLTPWYDEFGDDSLTQCNVPRGWLGLPLTLRPTTPTWSQGSLGVWSRQFTNGISLVNPRGNGPQTVTLPYACKKIQGTQASGINNGATVTTVTLGDGDGITMLKAA
jgi:hypothetical protein